MADIVVSVVCPFLQPIWSSIYQSAERRVKPICGLEDEIEKIQKKVPGIEAKLPIAEERAILNILLKKEDEVNYLFLNLQGMLYDADDVLDKWKTANLIKHIQKSAKKVCCLVPSFLCNRSSLLGDIASEINDVRKILQHSEEKVERLNKEQELIEDLRQFSSYGLTRVFYGRDEEKEILISKLNINVSSSDLNEGNAHKIIPILGMGGIGKSALAQYVYNHQTVKNYFVTIWVSFPFKFNLMKILRTIIEQVNFKISPRNIRNDEHVKTIQTLLDHFAGSIEGEKLLFVLDDVWEVNLHEWDQIIEAFQTSDPSSRILVTTQNYDVTRQMRASNDNIIHLKLLSASDCWSIVSSLASEADGGNRRSYEDLYNKFKSKCNGLPLVAHTLEHQLNSDFVNYFRSDIVDHEKILFGSYFVNYYGLSSHERRCFSYCSVFPRNYNIEHDDAVELWMSQDYFSECQTSPEETGRSCFKKLAERCLFQDVQKDYNGDILRCRMHELVYEFAQFLTKHERFVLELHEPEEEKKNEKARHFMLLLEASDAQIPNSMNKKNKLRTLFVVLASGTPSLSCDLLVKLTCLRTLYLGHCNVEKLPEDLHKLVHLRYLNLSGNPLTILPDALCYLFNLQSLRLIGCTKLERLPQGMGTLATNFRHLHIEGCDTLRALPKEIGELKYLQTLDMFIIPCPENPESYETMKLEDLSQLGDIHGTIHIRHCSNLENANALVRTRNLVLNGRRNHHVNLTLNFEGSSDPPIRDEQEILIALQPHSDLISLVIRGCMHTLYPGWINSLTCLKKLVLSGCRNWESLPLLGKLPLESLQIEDMDRVEDAGNEFLGIQGSDNRAISFPKLKELQMSCLTSWSRWEWTGNDSTIMPSLASLELSGCGRLGALPGFLQRIEKLQNLTIEGCTILSQRCQQGGDDWGKISHIPNVQVDGVMIIRPQSGSEPQATTSGSSAQITSGTATATATATGHSASINSSSICYSAAAMQASTSGSNDLPTLGACNGPYTSTNSSNMVQASTSDTSSIPASGSTAGPSTVPNLSTTCWYGT